MARFPASTRLLAAALLAGLAAGGCGRPERGTVAGTVILLKEVGWREEEIPALLATLDDDFLPDVDLERGTLNYTVVIGEVVGNWEAMAQP